MPYGEYAQCPCCGKIAYGKDEVEEKFGYMMMVAESDAFFYLINLAADYDVFQETKPLLMEYAVKIQIE